MALVPKKPGTEKPRPLVWESCFGGSMFVAPHKKGSRLEFFVTRRDRGTNTEPYWELSTGNNDGTGGPIRWRGQDPEDGKKFAQTIVDGGE